MYSICDLLALHKSTKIGHDKKPDWFKDDATFALFGSPKEKKMEKENAHNNATQVIIS